jgi:signal transduction histidine kinase
VYRTLSAPTNTIVAFAVSTTDIENAKSDVAKTIAVLALGMIALMTLLSYLIARSITMPIQHLVDHTRILASGDLSQKAVVKSHDEIGRLAGAFNDMTDQLRESEEKILHSAKLALTGQLAARVAHDIRNPLSSIKMQAQLLRNKLAPGQANRDSLAAILHEIDRVEWVVQGLLDLARPGKLHLEKMDVADVLNDALALTAAQMNHRHINVEKRFESGTPLIELDPDRLRQAFLNVLMNASEAMPGGGTILAVIGTEGDGTGVQIEISDDGDGLSEANRDKVFDPFFTTKREGVGLGLVNTKSIVERHGGTIRLLPRIERGTRVVITLPVVERSHPGTVQEPARNDTKIS